MNNNVYLIHEEDYIKHIDDKVQLFMMLQGLANLVSKLPTDEKNIPAIALAKHHHSESEKMFKTWGIPRSYLIFGSEAELADLMENELIAPEDAGYYPCDDECDCFPCSCGGCCECETDYDEDCDDEDKYIAEMMAELSDLIHTIFGDSVSVHIVVE